LPDKFLFLASKITENRNKTKIVNFGGRGRKCIE